MAIGRPIIAVSSMVVLLVAAFWAAVPARAAEPLAATTWEQALALSTQHQKPILIDFFTEW